MSTITSPIHRICTNPSSPILYLASSKFVHKYNVQSSCIDKTYESPNPSSVPQLLEASAEWLFVTGGDKVLRVLNAHTLETVAEFPLLKRASAITYDQETSSIIVADKTGEVYSFTYPIPSDQLAVYERANSLPPPDDKHPLTQPTDERFLGQWLLGHSSSVVALALADANWGRALVTGDRDEHVRISVFPQTWIIHAMGLGHTAFISCVTGVNGGVLTGGGDNKVICWGVDGTIRAEYEISEGSCVRCIRSWKEFVVVCGEKSSVVEVLALDRLDRLQQIQLPAPVLDIAFCENTMYISVDASEGNWLVEYQLDQGLWKNIPTDKWQITTKEATSADLYWLESMRKTVGMIEDE